MSAANRNAMDHCELFFEVVDESSDSPAQDLLSSSSSIPFDGRDGRGRAEGLRSGRMPRALLRDLNAALSCMLCGGYLVDAATLVDCLHSFCKVCIVRYLDTSKLCPICDVPVHKSKPLSCLRVDKTLQDIVYKVVPGLYQREMKQRREFYDLYPNAAAKVGCPEDRGLVDASARLIFSPQDTVSVSLEYFIGPTETLDPEDDGKEGVADSADGA
ncbi:hypothetical protein HPB47_018885, partial [Ixodes persulcatus]